MGGSWRRQARRALIALAAISAALALISPVAGAAEEVDDVQPPEAFGANASARAVSINLNREALLPIPDVFNFIALDGWGEYGSSSQQARASILFPGNGVILGPSLVCGTFGGQFPAEFKPVLDTCLKYQYPLTVFADSFDPDASTNGSLAFGTPSNDISLNATTARAHAAADSARTDAIVQDLRVLGIPPFGPIAIPGLSEQFKLDTSIVDIDSATSRTDQRTQRGGLVTTASVKMSGIKLIGGLIQIGSLTSVSRVTDDANGKRSSEADFDVTGVTVAGVPAKITNKGLVLGTSQTPVPKAALDAADAVLKTLNISLATLPTEEARDKDGAARASVGGVILNFARDVQGLPLLPSPIGQVDPNGVYTLTVQLGLTGVLGSAANYGTDEFTEDLEDTLSNVLGSDFDSSDFGFDDSASFGDDSGLGSTGALRPGRSARRGGEPATERTLVRSVANNFGGRLGFLYLTMMFTVLALCIAPRLAVPARLPGAKD